MADVLTPVHVAAYGRTGTTVLMSALATDDRVALDRVYPFENRYLTYLAKFALLTARASVFAMFNALHLENFEDDRFGPPPWSTGIGGAAASLMPEPDDWLSGMWQVFSASVQQRVPHFAAYAEKVPHWVAPVIRQTIASRTIHLVRDPRDVFLSARAFARARGAIGFGMDTTSDMEQARHTAHRLLSFHENARADRHRSDALYLRYEDLVTQPSEAVDRLNAALGLQISTRGVLQIVREDHTTSATVAASIGRWRREPLPDIVRTCLESQLRELMLDNGYELHAGIPQPNIVRLDEHVPSSSDGRLATEDDGLRVTLTGGNFHMEVPLESIDADAVNELWACVRGGSGDHCAVYWRGRNEPFVEERGLRAPYRPGPHWSVVRLRVHDHPLWSGNVSHLRIHLFNGSAPSGRSGQLRWIRFVE
jgi:Sulfotransferase family